MAVDDTFKKYQVLLDPEDDELLHRLIRLEKLNKSDLFRRGLRRLGEDHGLWPPAAAPDSETNATTSEAQSA